MRYFWVSFSAEGATGACDIVATKFLNHREFKEQIQKMYPQLVNPCVMSWVEMTKEEYEVFKE